MSLLEMPNNTTQALPGDFNGTVNGEIAGDCQQGSSTYLQDMTFIWTQLVINVGLVLTLCVFGLAGNIISFVVLGKMTDGATPCLLRSLALADSTYLITCVFAVSGETLNIHMEKFFVLFPFYPHVARCVWPVANTAQTTSVWLVVLVTCNRWVAVCYPLKAKQVNSKRKARIAILLVVLGAVLFNISTVFELQVVEVSRTACDNSTRLAVMVSDMTKNATYQLVYRNVLCFLFRTSLPIALLIFFNAHLVRAIRQSASHDGKVTSTSRPGLSHHKFTAVVVGLVTVFIVCMLPSFVYRVLLAVKLYITSSGLTWGQLSYLSLVANFMLTVNSAVNFLIYFAVGRNFRQCLRQVCCCGRRDDDKKQQQFFSTRKTKLSNCV